MRVTDGLGLKERKGKVTRLLYVVYMGRGQVGDS